jgi:hypothetical protein
VSAATLKVGSFARHSRVSQEGTPRRAIWHPTPWKESFLIYVSKEQLDQVEYLIGQSILGNHVLFDVDTVRRVFDSPKLTDDASSGDASSGSVEEAYSVEHHIERLMVQPGLDQKRAYLEKLDPYTFEKVVRTYFNIVENNMYENVEVRH